MHKSIKHTHLLEMASSFKGILLDAYGVFWAGNAVGMLPGAKEAMEALMQNGKIIGILSNATRISVKEEEKLAKHGIEKGKHYHFLITSGQICRENALKDKYPFQVFGNKYYVLGGPYPDKSIHKEIFEGTKFYETQELEDADFIYASTPQLNGVDQTSFEPFKDMVHKCAEYNLPLVCANPDHHAQEGNPPQVVVRQGKLAQMYKDLEKEVHFIGKPYQPSFEKAFEEFNKISKIAKIDILMIGDTPETDIIGAKNFGFKAALITETGIFAERMKNQESSLKKLLPDDEYPDYFLKRFSI